MDKELVEAYRKWELSSESVDFDRYERISRRLEIPTVLDKAEEVCRKDYTDENFQNYERIRIKAGRERDLDVAPYRISYDESEITEDRIRHLMSEDCDPDIENCFDNEEEARQDAYDDPDLYSSEWEYVINDLDEWMKELDKDKTGHWADEHHRSGWGAGSGEHIIEAENASALTRRLLGNIGQFTLHGSRYSDHIDISISHHDGSDYHVLYPMTEKEYNQHYEEGNI